MGIVLLVLAVGFCCLLLPLLIAFGMSQSKEDRGRLAAFLPDDETGETEYRTFR